MTKNWAVVIGARPPAVRGRPGRHVLVRPDRGKRWIHATQRQPRPGPGDHLGCVVPRQRRRQGDCRHAARMERARCAQRAGIADRDIQTSSISLIQTIAVNNQPRAMASARRTMSDQVRDIAQERPRRAGRRGRTDQRNKLTIDKPERSGQASTRRSRGPAPARALRALAGDRDRR